MRGDGGDFRLWRPRRPGQHGEPMTTNRRRLRDLSAPQRAAVFFAGSVQVILAVTAWWDLVRRDATRVNGPKALWAAVIGVNFVGPVAYFLAGRRAVETARPDAS